MVQRRYTFYLILFIFSFATAFIIASFFKAKNTTRVLITDTGFYPENITIREGETIEFLVQGKRQYWPASNFHPTHNLYPEKGGCIGSRLDSCRAMRDHEKYFFKFKKIGTWIMHDHLHPGFTMSIEVSESGISSTKETADSSALRTEPYGKQQDIIKTMSQEDPRAAWAHLKKSFLVQGQVTSGSAHNLAHIIGNKMFDNYGFDGMTFCDSTFSFGCYHGVTERMLGKLGISSIKKDEEHCMQAYPAGQGSNLPSCIHGMGHGIVSWRGLDIKKSLVDCDDLKTDNRESCYDGVFMEYAESAPFNVFDSQNPWKFCQNMDKQYYTKCAKYQTNINIQKFSANKSTLIKICESAPDLSSKDNCFYGFGVYISSVSKGQENLIIKDCSIIKDKDGLYRCIMYAAQDVAFQKYTGWHETAINLCNSLTLSQKAECYGRLKDAVGINIL